MKVSTKQDASFALECFLFALCNILGGVVVVVVLASGSKQSSTVSVYFSKDGGKP